MRDPNRLDSFYAKLCELHKNNFPDMRFGQFISNIALLSDKDIYFPEEDEMLEIIETFINKCTKKVNHG